MQFLPSWRAGYSGRHRNCDGIHQRSRTPSSFEPQQLTQGTIVYWTGVRCNSAALDLGLLISGTPKSRFNGQNS